MQSKFFKGLVFATLTTATAFSFIACDKTEDVLNTSTSTDSLAAADARGGGKGSTTTTTKGGNGSTTVAAADVPAAVTTAFTAKYPSATSVTWTKSSDGTVYDAHFLNGTTQTSAEFNADGTFVTEHTLIGKGGKDGKGDKGGKGGGTIVAAADVPAAVTTAFTAKYPSATNVSWTKSSDGTVYHVHFLNGTIQTSANFNVDGTFVSENTASHTGRGGKGGGTIVAAADVPAAVTTAFTAKYPSATSVTWTLSSDGTVYDAHFLNGTTQTSAEFNADGTFVTEHTLADKGGKGGGTIVAAADVPAAVTTAFTAKYPSATSVTWTKSSDGTVYDAHFLNGTTPTSAEFNADGTFVTEHTLADKGGKGGKRGH